jgi:small subunit ribosomal protein S16
MCSRLHGFARPSLPRQARPSSAAAGSPPGRQDADYTELPGEKTAPVAVKIKLKRLGKIHAPYYRIVVADARTKRDGRAIEEIGKYHPKAEPSYIEVVSERAQYWLSVGAQPTEPVRRLLEITGDWQKFRGQPGTEGTLRTAAAKTAKSERFAEAVSQGKGASAEAKGSAEPQKGKARRSGSGQEPEGKTGAKAEGKTGAKAEGKTDAKAEGKADAKAEGKTDGRKKPAAKTAKAAKPADETADAASGTAAAEPAAPEAASGTAAAEPADESAEAGSGG